MTRPFDPTTGEPDPFSDRIDVPPYVPEPIDHWDYVLVAVVAGALIAFLVWWAGR